MSSDSQSTKLNHVNETAYSAALCRVQDGFGNDSDKSFLENLIKTQIGSNVPNNSEKGIAKWIIRVRTIAFDNFIQNLICTGEIDGVLNIGAGMDLRMTKMNLKDDVTWIECDIGEIVKIKKKLISRFNITCNYEIFETDVTDSISMRKLISYASGKCSKILVNSEGLLCYLSKEQVINLSDLLFEKPNVLYWSFDLNSPWAINNMNAKQKKEYNKKTYSIKFAPVEGAFFLPPNLWQTHHVELAAGFARKCKIPIPQPWRLLLGLASKKTKNNFENACSFNVMKRNLV